MTEGEYRVGVSFNPSARKDVDNVKKVCAVLIDDLVAISADRNEAGAREAAIAATKFEEACMWAVKALTKPKR